MVQISQIKDRAQQGKRTIDQLCSVKRYLKTSDKFKLAEEYKDVIQQHKDDFNGAIPFIGFVYFHLLVIKYYTNIDIEMSYSCFDELMESDILPLVLGYIDTDYNLLLKVCNLNLGKE